MPKSHMNHTRQAIFTEIDFLQINLPLAMLSVPTDSLLEDYQWTPWPQVYKEQLPTRRTRQRWRLNLEIENYLHFHFQATNSRVHQRWCWWLTVSLMGTHQDHMQYGGSFTALVDDDFWGSELWDRMHIFHSLILPITRPIVDLLDSLALICF